MDCESRLAALKTHKQRTMTPRHLKRRTPPMNFVTMEGWRSVNLTFCTTPINPDLDIYPTNRYELTQHPTKPRPTLLHKRDGTLICTIDNRRLDKLHDIYNNAANNPPFEESLSQLIHRNDKQHHPKKIPSGTTT